MLTPAPRTVLDLSESCIHFVDRSLGVSPDYTPETLPLLDRYLRQLPRRGCDELLGLLVPTCGAYFGEVVRRRLDDGSWDCPEDDHAAWRLEFGGCSLKFNPLGVAVEVALGETTKGWASEYSVAKEDRERAREALALFGEALDRDYYSFSVRYEVLDQLYHSLLKTGAAAGDAGQDPKRFSER